MEPITTGEIADVLAQLEAATQAVSSQTGWYSTSDLAAASGRNERTIQERLRRALRAGKWEARRIECTNCVGERTRQIRWRPVQS